MPRVRLSGDQRRSSDESLVARLAQELRSDSSVGQPMVYEQAFGSGNLRVTVIWDAWDRQPLERRTSTILAAYAEAGGTDSRERITLASGLTVPEAVAAGMLPYQVIAAVRKDDPVAPEECAQAMIAIGATTLLDEQRPQLRFATSAEADNAVKELIKRLPGSEQVWVVTQEAGTVADWLEN